VLTGNHYWIDGLGGLICLGLGFLAARAVTNRGKNHRTRDPVHTDL
jgi:hypothetical protein